MRARIAVIALAATIGSAVAAPQAAGFCPAPSLPPTAKLTATPSEGVAGERVAFDGSTSLPGSTAMMIEIPDPFGGLPTCVPGGPILNPVIAWTWSFGDGTAPVSEADALVDHVFAATGTYTVKLEVLAGALTHTATLPVVVKAKPVDPAPPVVTPPVVTTPPVTAPVVPVAPVTAVVPPVATKTLKSNAVYCAAASKKRVKRTRATSYSRCVSALAKLRSKKATTAAQACRSSSRKIPRSHSRQCKAAAGALLRDMAA